MLPNFVIVGAQKAGTTSVAAGVRSHPDIYMPAPELAFFEDPEYQTRDLAWLEGQFSTAGDACAVGFKRPNLLADPDCPARIHGDLPGAKIIVMLRDPVIRAVSAYWHTMAGGKIPLCNMEQGLERILDGVYDRAWPAAKCVLEYGLYDEQLDRYDKLIGSDRLLVTLQDDLKSDATGLYRRIFQFLDVDDSFTPPRPGKISMGGRYSMVRQAFGRWTTPLYMRMSQDRTRRYDRRGPVAVLCRKACRGVDRYVVGPLTRGPRPELSVDLHKRLVSYYASDVAKLRVRLDRPLEGWLARR